MVKRLQYGCTIQVLLVLLASALAAPVARSQFLDDEREALEAFYYATDGDNWTRNDNWLSDADVDTWYGLEPVRISYSDPRRGVHTISLPGNNLRGEIPPEIGNLRFLTHLELGDNELTGGLPSALGELENLRTLDVSGNAGLTGDLPFELTNVRGLERLWFDGTDLCEPDAEGYRWWVFDVRDVRRTGCGVPDIPLSITGTCDPALAEAYLDGNAVRARIPNNGGLFYRSEPHVYNVPSHTESNALFASGIWIGGLIENHLRMAATRYGPYEFWPGPLDDEGRPPEDCSVYDRMYKVERRDIESYEDTGIAAGDLAEWPTGLGAPTLDAAGNRIEVDHLPFVHRRDRVIDLEAGERPDIPGDQVIWWVMNDRGNVHNASDTPNLGIEVRAMAYALNSGSHALHHATYYHYTIVNRNTYAIKKAYIGVFSDPDLGDAGDDYVGSDTLRNIAYVYNSDDDDRGGEGYGRAPPAVGYRILKGPRADDDGFDNDRDGIVDESDERPGMSHFVYYNNGGGPNEDPSTAEDYYNFMRGFWKNGNRILYGGDGFETNVTTRPANHMFPGDPVTGEGWSEVNPCDGCARNPAADRRFVLSSGPFDLAPGEAKTIDFAVVYGRGVNNIDSVDEMRRASDIVQTAFDENFAWYPPGLKRDDAPTLLSPGRGATDQPTSTTLYWNEPPGGGSYQVWLASSEGSSYLKSDRPDLNVENLEPHTIYRWSVRAFSKQGTTPWSEPRYFATGDRINRTHPLTFTVVQNASGRLSQPDLATVSNSESDFPTIVCPGFSTSVCTKPTRGYQQSESDAVWVIHAGAARNEYGSVDDSDTFLGRLIDGEETLERIGNFDYEWRWVGLGNGGLGYDPDYGNGFFDVGFELWNIGAGTANDLSDDYRMIPVIDVRQGGNPLEPETVFNIGGDRRISENGVDPVTNFVSWFDPFEPTPGEQGFLDVVAGTRALGERVFRAMILVQLDAGDGPPFDAELPEPGTVFRIVSGAFNVASLSAPANEEKLAPGSVGFYWTGREGLDHRIQISERSDFATTIIDYWNAPSGFSKAFTTAGRYFWRVQSESGFWSNTWSFVIDDASDGTLPEEPFVLYDNFPNPFSNGTTLNFYLPTPAHVRLEVFDMLGRSVRVPIDEVLGDGQHYMPFDAGNLTSGMYIYRFTAAGRTETRKMVVTR